MWAIDFPVFDDIQKFVLMQVKAAGRGRPDRDRFV